MVRVDDTALAVTDTDGPGIPEVYLNGSYASQRSQAPRRGRTHPTPVTALAERPRT
ncbi:hypothetical protein [Actinopolymorpha pittospori]|uniref:Uncharacterized protein n=1 Tax=Actinopolymorpha pittospori TaxID=648752 RepID=A0A927MU79_9ACTN|nr:hypothetical protein [Actinopolymorpha pittospori]MBE1606995.1 hypothetical protein [Actinopolymorpha pittospori]